MVLITALTITGCSLSKPATSDVPQVQTSNITTSSSEGKPRIELMPIEPASILQANSLQKKESAVTAGKKYRLRWKSYNLPQNTGMYLALRSLTDEVIHAVKVDASVGEYVWQMPNANSECSVFFLDESKPCGEAIFENSYVLEAAIFSPKNLNLN